MDTVCSHFQKNAFTWFQTRRTTLIRNALESSDPSAFNRGSNVEIGPPGANLVRFEVARLPSNRVFFCKDVDRKSLFFGNSDFSNSMRSAPSGQISTFDPAFDATGTVLCSVLQISAVRHT